MTHTVAILTGASRGIGAAMARQLAKPGTRLITLARREDPELAAHARAQDAQLEQLAVDLSDLRAAEQAAERICAALPRDAKRYLLINNAGTVHPVSGTDALIDGQAIASAFNLNVTAVMLLTARFLAAVEDLPADRRVLNISSGAGRNPNAGWGVYCATRRRWTCTRAWSSRNRARPARASSRWRPASSTPTCRSRSAQATRRISRAVQVPGIPRHRQAILARQRGHPHPRLPGSRRFRHG